MTLGRPKKKYKPPLFLIFRRVNGIEHEVMYVASEEDAITYINNSRLPDLYKIKQVQ